MHRTHLTTEGTIKLLCNLHLNTFNPANHARPACVKLLNFQFCIIYAYKYWSVLFYATFFDKIVRIIMYDRAESVYLWKCVIVCVPSYNFAILPRITRHEHVHVCDCPSDGLHLPTKMVLIFSVCKCLLVLAAR